MHPRRGAVLLEVMAAVMIFSFAAISALELLSQVAQTQRADQARARTVMDQNRLLSAYSLLSADDLERRLGYRIVGEYRVSVRRPETTLYYVEIGDSTGPELATVLYRPRSSGPAP